MTDDELLSTYLDGELSNDDEMALQERLNHDPVLSESLNRMCALGMSRAYDDIQGMSYATHFEVLTWSQASNFFKHPFNSISERVPFQIAAIVLIAAACALTNIMKTGNSQLADSFYSTQKVFNKEVSVILDTASSQTVTNVNSTTKIQPVLSYASFSNEYCREYILNRGSKVFRGVACRNESGLWQERISSIIPKDAKGNPYHMVRVADIEKLTHFINKTMRGLPLNAEEEANIIRSNWTF